MRRVLSSLCACALLLGAPSGARARPKARIRLVVLVTIDQLGTTYMRRWGALATQGIGELARRGAYFPEALFAYANTETAPGHATIATGAWPNVHGITANYWFDPKTGERINCVRDPEAGKSPRNLVVPTFADALKLATDGRSKTISLAIKDRAAILVAGNRPNAAVWYEPEKGRFVRGTWDRREAGAEGSARDPTWLARVNLTRSADAAFGEMWSHLRSDLDYDFFAGSDDDPTESTVPGLGRVFPRRLGEGLPGVDASWRDAFAATPQALEALLSLAAGAFSDEKLGRGEAIDFLALGISSLDYAGHWWGPRSHEALDLFLRIDRGLAELASTFEKHLGGGAVLWVVTGDHGVAMTPEDTEAFGVRAERVDQRRIIRELDEGLARGRGERTKGAVLDLNAPRLYLKYGEEVRERAEIQRAAAGLLRAFPAILDARAALDVGAFTEPYRTLFERSTFPGREPDVFLLTRPHDLIEIVAGGGRGTGSGHGSPYLYDASVPVIFAGPGVRRGEDRSRYEMIQVAPTLAELLDIEPPAAARGAPLPLLEPRD